MEYLDKFLEGLLIPIVEVTYELIKDLKVN